MGLCMMMFRALLSSSTPETCMSCEHMQMIKIESIYAGSLVSKTKNAKSILKYIICILLFSFYFTYLHLLSLFFSGRSYNTVLTCL